MPDMATGVALTRTGLEDEVESSPAEIDGGEQPAHCLKSPVEPIQGPDSHVGVLRLLLKGFDPEPGPQVPEEDVDKPLDEGRQLLVGHFLVHGAVSHRGSVTLTFAGL